MSNMNEQEALMALAGMVKTTNAETIHRNNNYATKHRSDIDAENTETIDSKAVANYMMQEHNFDENRAPTMEEMNDAKRAAMGTGYGFSGFATDAPQGQPYYSPYQPQPTAPYPQNHPMMYNQPMITPSPVVNNIKMSRGPEEAIQNIAIQLPKALIKIYEEQKKTNELLQKLLEASLEAATFRTKKAQSSKAKKPVVEDTAPVQQG